MSDYSVILIHKHAPAKPMLGAPCNGCGVCCASAPCPVSAFLLKHREGGCCALVWDQTTRQYRCGMLLTPSHYCGWLPKSLNTVTSKLIRRWIAVGVGCDSEAQISAQAD
ncbi:hypothetical protein E2I14_09430 [Sapientia aquatica]|uniref:4Fe-4S ferredoxin-type domain-containing protein n=1 Tax=Sapientia aquatica TaxID=1549640 RepID=A0A4R5W2S9_9BURK|nr:hypothetical protein E2I14_09430 [Sapientia aquatica]